MPRTPITVALAISALLLALGAAAAVNQTEITNRVNVSAVSGQNSGGGVRSGNASAASKIKTVVNGEVVESISIEAKATAGEETIEQHIATSTENGTHRIETTVTVNAHATTPTTTTAAAPRQYRQPPAPSQPAIAPPTAGAAARLRDGFGPEFIRGDFFLRLHAFLARVFRFP